MRSNSGTAAASNLIEKKMFFLLSCSFKEKGGWAPHRKIRDDIFGAAWQAT
jgi:hypothetical protein